MELSKEILEAAKKSLTGAYAEALSEFIKDAKANEVALESKTVAYDALYKDNANNKIKIQNLENTVAKTRNILDREDILYKAEQAVQLNQLKFNIEKQVGEIKVEEATKRVDSIYTLVGLFMKNTDISKMVSSNMCTQTGQDYNPAGGTHRYVTNENTVSTEQELRNKTNPPQPGVTP